jgi:hypothetical protein
VVQPHTCLSNKGKENHQSLDVTLPIIYWGSLLTIMTFRCLSYNSPYPDSFSMV